MVWRPRWSPSRTSVTAWRASPSRALINVDLPVPLAPRNASVRPPAANARNASTPAPVRPLATSTGTPRATSTSSRRAGSGSSTRSALVSTTAGSAPLSNASTSSRSRRRCFGSSPKECVRKTTSMFAASVWATARLPSNEARRTNAERRGSTYSTRSSSSLGTTQSPTATSAPMLRTRRVPTSVSTVLQPRSSRLTRPGRPVPPCSCHARSRSSSQPSDRSAPSAPIAGSLPPAVVTDVARFRGVTPVTTPATVT